MAKFSPGDRVEIEDIGAGEVLGYTRFGGVDVRIDGWDGGVLPFVEECLILIEDPVEDFMGEVDNVVSLDERRRAK